MSGRTRTTHQPARTGARRPPAPGPQPELFDRITFDPNVMGGRASIRSMRIPVPVIVSQLAHEATFEEILTGYPDLERADIQQAIEYAARLAREEVQLSS